MSGRGGYANGYGYSDSSRYDRSDGAYGSNNLGVNGYSGGGGGSGGGGRQREGRAGGYGGFYAEPSQQPSLSPSPSPSQSPPDPRRERWERDREYSSSRSRTREPEANRRQMGSRDGWQAPQQQQQQQQPPPQVPPLGDSGLLDPRVARDRNFSAVSALGSQAVEGSIVSPFGSCARFPLGCRVVGDSLRQC